MPKAHKITISDSKENKSDSLCPLNRKHVLKYLKCTGFARDSWEGGTHGLVRQQRRHGPSPPGVLRRR